MKLCAVVWTQKKRFLDLQFCIRPWVDTLKVLNIKTYIAIENSYKVLSDTNNFNYIKYPSSKWKMEWLKVLEQLKKKKITHIFSILDDFYIFSTDFEFFKFVLNIKNLRQIDYLNLNYHPDQVSQKLGKKFKLFDIVPKDSDYRASVQFSFWKIDYMKKMISRSNTIWSLENTSSSSITHYCVKKPIIKYRHVVEKNQWNFNIFRLPIKILTILLTKSNIEYNFSQLKFMHRILISNFFINFLGLKKWKKIKSAIYKYFRIA